VDLIPAAVRAYKAARDVVGLGRLRLVCAEAFREPCRELTADLELAAADDPIEIAYLLNPCRATAEPRLRALDRRILHKCAVRAALCEKWNL